MYQKPFCLLQALLHQVFLRSDSHQPAENIVEVVGRIPCQGCHIRQSNLFLVILMYVLQYLGNKAVAVVIKLIQTIPVVLAVSLQIVKQLQKLCVYEIRFRVVTLSEQMVD